MDRRTKQLIEKYVIKDYSSKGYSFDLTLSPEVVCSEGSICLDYPLINGYRYWSASKKAIFALLDSIPLERILIPNMTLAELVMEVEEHAGS